MRIIKRISVFIAVLLVVCMLMPCALADTWDLENGTVNIEGGANGKNQLVTQGENSKEDNNPIITGTYNSNDGSAAVTVDSSKDIPTLTLDSGFGSNVIQINGGNGDIHQTNIYIDTSSKVILTGDEKASVSIWDFNSDNDVNTQSSITASNITVKEKLYSLDVKTSGNLNLALDNAEIETNINANNAVKSTPTDFNVEVIGKCEVGCGGGGESSISSRNLNLNIHSSSSISNSLTIKDGIGSNTSLQLNNVNLSAEKSSYTGESVTFNNCTADLVSSVIEGTTININSSKIDLSDSIYYGILCAGERGCLNINNSSVNIETIKVDDSDLTFGIVVYSKDSKIAINSSDVKISVPSGGIALAAANLNPKNSTASAPSINLIDSSIVEPDKACLFNEPSYSLDPFGSFNATYIANSDGTFASNVKIIAQPSSNSGAVTSLYSITDLDRKPVAVKETRDGSILTLTAEADDVILTLTPAQARQLLKNGVEKLVVKTNGHEYTLDMVKIVEALKTNEANTVLTTNGSDYKLLIGTDAHPEFVTVK